MARRSGPKMPCALPRRIFAYLRSLHAAVVEAGHDGATREEARAAASAVELPRDCAPDLAEMRGFNVDRQIDEIFGAA